MWHFRDDVMGSKRSIAKAHSYALCKAVLQCLNQIRTFYIAYLARQLDLKPDSRDGGCRRKVGLRH